MKSLLKVTTTYKRAVVAVTVAVVVAVEVPDVWPDVVPVVVREWNPSLLKFHRRQRYDSQLPNASPVQHCDRVAFYGAALDRRF